MYCSVVLVDPTARTHGLCCPAPNEMPQRDRDRKWHLCIRLTSERKGWKPPCLMDAGPDSSHNRIERMQIVCVESRTIPPAAREARSDERADFRVIQTPARSHKNSVRCSHAWSVELSEAAAVPRGWLAEGAVRKASSSLVLALFHAAVML